MRWTLIVAVLCLSTPAAAQMIPGVGNVEDLKKDALGSAKAAEATAMGRAAGLPDGVSKAMHTCDTGSGVVKHEDKTITLKKGEGAAFFATGNCVLRLKNVTVRAPHGLILSGNAKVTLDNVTFETRQHAVRLTGNAQLTINGGSLRAKKKAAILVTGTTRLRVNGASLTAKKGKAVVRVTGTSRLSFEKARLRGKRALRVTGVSRINVKDSTFNKKPWRRKKKR